MLNKKQINEIKEHLSRAQNPIFYYDNDADGLCSFLLLRRYLGRGYGVAIRSYPELNAQYATKAQQLKADYVFILDKPVVSKEFLDEIKLLGLNVVWIDHHQIDKKEFEKEFSKFDNLYFYNSATKKEGGEPVSYIAYKLTERKEDLWIALMGCVADYYLPDFTDEFAERYSNFWIAKKKIIPFDAYFGSEIGRIAIALNFGLKDSVSHVVELQNFLISCKGPEDVFLETEVNRKFREKYSEIKKKYEALLTDALKNASEKMIFFEYSGDLSISADLANELWYKNQDKYIAVCYKKGAITNISMRGRNVLRILKKILAKIENATGGGHRDAVGARIRTENLGIFRELMEKEIGK
ncbi:MAG: DHHA1 domain-containing protein [Candidatus Pacearchaeota archaeon]